MKEQRDFDKGLGILGGQVPRLYGGTIFGGVRTTLGASSGAFSAKSFRFLDTFAAAKRVLGID